MNVPDWYQLLLLGIAAWRIFNLLAYDKILDRPRNVVLGLPWRWQEGDEVPAKWKNSWGLFLVCPYCLGFWTAALWWVAFQISETWSTGFAALFVIASIVIPLAQHLTPED